MKIDDVKADARMVLEAQPHSNKSVPEAMKFLEKDDYTREEVIGFGEYMSNYPWRQVHAIMVKLSAALQEAPAEVDVVD